ncbi:MFS general substrate transporter [Chloropicon primus]|uniref:MFS general substrate transporter n=2 Tax=Chloropicon primus TaxID=1764295 RepID=A0A5B8MZ68_9CHLO|nr:MFS general substrate transporter [Chloropicon primus]|eukprot:QDZ25937.1 MFS general substrate transporter [Chloropicon primus]
MARGSVAVRDGEERAPRGGVPRSTLICIGLPLISTQFSWSVQTAYATTLFKQLGATQRDLSYLRVPGPVTGLFVQPLSGLWTDYSGFRWRPLTVIASTALCASGFVLLPLGETSGSIWTVFAGFCIIDVGFNAADALVRVLVADVTEKERLPLANSVISSALGTGQLLGFVSGAIGDALVRLFGSDASVSSLTFACGVGLGLLVVCDLAFGSACRSKQFPSETLGGSHQPYALLDEESGAEREKRALVERKEVERSKVGDLSTMWRHPWMWKLCLMNGLAWMGWFCFIFFAPDFIGIDVCAGDPHAPKSSEAFKNYEKAQKVFSISSAISSCIMLAFSWAIPTLVSKFGIRRMMAASALMLSAILWCSSLIREGDTTSCVFLFSLIGFPWSMTMSLPYTVVSTLSSESERGRLMGVLNIFVVIPSFVVLSLVGATGLASATILNAGAATAAAAALLFLLVPISSHV